MKEQRAEASEVRDDPGQATQSVVTQDECSKMVQFTQLIRDRLQQVAAKVQNMKAEIYDL